MKIYLTLVGLFLAVLCAPRGLPQDSRITTTTELLPDGHIRFVVTNRSTQSITALYVKAVGIPLVSGIPRIVSHRFFDSVINIFNERDLAPQGDHVFILGGPSPGPSKSHIDPVLQAALFSDGSSWGDAASVQRLIERRKFMHRYVNAAVKVLQDASTNGVPREQLIHQIQTLRAAISSAVSDKDERPFALGVYDEVLDNLRMDESSPPEALPVGQRIALVISQLLKRQRKLESSKSPLAQYSATVRVLR